MAEFFRPAGCSATRIEDRRQRYVKMRFSDYNRQDGTIKLKYVYAPDGSLKLE